MSAKLQRPLILLSWALAVAAWICLWMRPMTWYVLAALSVALLAVGVWDDWRGRPVRRRRRRHMPNSGCRVNVSEWSTTGRMELPVWAWKGPTLTRNALDSAPPPEKETPP